ncbi:g11277 [Coccomyxa viridis]|uniref:G11277 protein n=1 Tax=Coccomyxa viridis TaxID=1274662 RepID=A0ABP1G7W3_9CHLO
MSSQSYKADYQASITANRIVKDLVKQKMPKGETFDPVKGAEGKTAQTGRDVLTSVVHSKLMSGCLDEECLTHFGHLTEAQQLEAASEFERRLPGNIRNPSAFLVKIMANVKSANNISAPTPARSAARSPPMPAISNGRLIMQRLISNAGFLDDLPPECRRAYEKLPSEAQYRVKQMCAEDASVSTNSKAFMHAVHGVTSVDHNVLLPANWADAVDEDLREDVTPDTHQQAWPPLPAHTQPLTRTPQQGQAPSQGGGQSTSAAPKVAAPPPARQEAPENGKGATDSHNSFWADPEAAEVKLNRGKKGQTGRNVLASIVKRGMLSESLDQECLSYFGELTESQQLQAAGMFKHRVNKDVKNPSALLTRLAANVQNASKISGLKHPTPSANYIPAKPGSYLNAQRFSDTLFLYNLSAECRRTYERLPSEAQYRVKQRCAEDEAVRTYSEAFLNAICDITGQGRPQQQPHEVPEEHAWTDGISEDELIPAKWPDSADEGLHGDCHQRTEVQAWPEDAAETQPKRRWSSESQAIGQREGFNTAVATDAGHNMPGTPHNQLQAWPPNALETQVMEDTPPECVPNQTPIQKAGHGVSAAAAPEPAGKPYTAQAVDAAARELMGLLVSV